MILIVVVIELLENCPPESPVQIFQEWLADFFQDSSPGDPLEIFFKQSYRMFSLNFPPNPLGSS